jgi:hypothetical protein
LPEEIRLLPASSRQHSPADRRNYLLVFGRAYLNFLERSVGLPLLDGVNIKMELSMSRARIGALSVAAVLALSSAALAQGGGGGGGGAGGAGGGAAGGTSSGAGGAAGANSGVGGTSGTDAAQSTRGQSSPTGNTAAQPPGTTGQNSINSPGTGVGPGNTSK